jgi:hypothetical protein
VALVVLMILPPAATAGSGTDPSNPSLDQYVESVPTSHGDHPQPPAGGTSPSGHLPPSVRHRLAAQGGADAKQLDAIATSPSLGAPSSQSAPARGSAGRPSNGGTGTGGAASAADERSPSAISAVARAATGGDGSSVVVLVGGLALITALMAAVALGRRRSTSP